MTAMVDVRGVLAALGKSVPGPDVSAEKPAAKPKPDEKARRGGAGMAYKIAIRFINEHPLAVKNMLGGTTPLATAKAYFRGEEDPKRFAVALRAMRLARQLGRGLGDTLAIPEVKSGKRWLPDEDQKLLRLGEQYPGNPARIAREMGFARSLRAYMDRLYYLQNRKPKG